MGKRIVIAGAGGFGRGLHGWLASAPQYCEEQGIDDIVFIDDQPVKESLPARVVASITDYQPRVPDELICAIGVPGTRRSIIERLRTAGAQFHTYLDPRAVLSEGVRVGAGSIICPGTVLSSQVVLGEHVHVKFNCSVGHDTTLGDFATLSPAVNIMGEVLVGSMAFLGGSAVVLPRLSVGVASVVGAGAVVIAPVPAGATVVGNPARVVRRRSR